ncbi:hypothetical protein HanHA300_Chr04g0118771 [Helianthus annuus]|nr:hypothetical protein HanHA300_Chr04g0118771 [Helianthus annuus]KAJ0595414.1 hypothetical protein HanHA89_Chr04g0131101 [Helianthus annuus]KAJ0756090.1 hypothetical protein HanLR1_Chr04g0123111 [Helianthus annuus]
MGSLTLNPQIANVDPNPNNVNTKTPYRIYIGYDLREDVAYETVYPRKNWSSMVLYNCGHPKYKVLSLEVENKE